MKIDIARFGIGFMREHALNLSAVTAARRLEAGVEVDGITFAAAPDDQQAFSKLLSLLREAENLITDPDELAQFLAQPQVVADIHGMTHIIPDVRSLRAALVSYGMQIRDLWTEKARRDLGIRSAATTDELHEILDTLTGGMEAEGTAD